MTLQLLNASHSNFALGLQRGWVPLLASYGEFEWLIFSFGLVLVWLYKSQHTVRVENLSLGHLDGCLEFIVKSIMLPASWHTSPFCWLCYNFSETIFSCLISFLFHVLCGQWSFLFSLSCFKVCMVHIAPVWRDMPSILITNSRCR